MPYATSLVDRRKRASPLVIFRRTLGHNMHCIICRQEKPERTGQGEHVIPLSLGGSWTIDRVCEDCDNKMGTRWDAGLAKLAVIEDRRLEFGLVGHSGRLPNPIRDGLARPCL